MLYICANCNAIYNYIDSCCSKCGLRHKRVITEKEKEKYIKNIKLSYKTA